MVRVTDEGSSLPVAPMGRPSVNTGVSGAVTSPRRLLLVATLLVAKASAFTTSKLVTLDNAAEREYLQTDDATDMEQENNTDGTKENGVPRAVSASASSWHRSWQLALSRHQHPPHQERRVTEWNTIAANEDMALTQGKDHQVKAKWSCCHAHWPHGHFPTPHFHVPVAQWVKEGYDNGLKKGWVRHTPAMTCPGPRCPD